MTKIICIFVLFFIFACSAKANTLASDSAQQELTLTILPALETYVQENGAPTIDGRTLRQDFVVYARSNTSWAFEALPIYDSGRIYLADCNDNGYNLPRNQDNAFQIYSFSCWQPLSWGDKSTSPIQIDFLVWQNF